MVYTKDDPLSTFALDVDTASYAVARRFVQDGYLPHPDAVRVEEFVNYFFQGYEPPEEHAFAIHIDGSPSPFGGSNQWLMRVGVQGRIVKPEDRKDVSLVFLIDVSTSMDQPNRLGLVKRSLRLLVEQLRPTDQVAIVAFNSRAFVLLEPTGGDQKQRIIDAIFDLQAGGSTNVAQALLVGYHKALEMERPGRIPRILLLSDGVATGGRPEMGLPKTLAEIAEEQARSGIPLSTVGVGMGDFNDIVMEQLAINGNGTYAYVDTLVEARRVFVEQLTSALEVIAKDAKLQVVFNPDVVRRYRLIGYENRDLADEKFRSEIVEASEGGEIGADLSVTALYELELAEGADGTVATVHVRYEDPDLGKVLEISRVFPRSAFSEKFVDASPRLQLAAAVAEYAEILRASYWAQGGNLSNLATLSQRVRRLLPQDPDVAEFAELVTRAENIKSRGGPES